MQPRGARESKASLAEGLRFARHLRRLRSPCWPARSAESARPPAAAGCCGAFLFGLVGLSGLLVNTAVLVLLLGLDCRLHYLVAAVVATEASTTWLFLLTERLVFRGAKPAR